MLKEIKSAGLLLNSLRGFVWLTSLAPSGFVLLRGWFEGLTWSQTVALTMATLACGIVIAFFGLKLFALVTSRVTGRADRKRIRDQITALRNSGYKTVDTPTIAAIWAGSMEQGNVDRHIKFRLIKAAVDSGRIQGAVLNGDGANKNTQIPIDALESFFVEDSIIDAR